MTKGPDGGSVHDPDANLPRPMWQRKPAPTRHECQACTARKRPRTKLRLQVKGGPVPGAYMICPVCDGTAGAVPPTLRE